MKREILNNTPEFKKRDILFLKDDSFTPDNICIVTGSASGAGRATVIAAAANNLMTVGLDMDEAGGKETQKIARDMGGQTIFIKINYCSDKQLEFAVEEAAKIGSIRYLANIPPFPAANPSGTMSLKEYDCKYKLMMRMPFFMSQRVLGHMMERHDRPAVIGNILWKHPDQETLHLAGSSNIANFGIKKHTNIRNFTITCNYHLSLHSSDKAVDSNGTDRPYNDQVSHQCLQGRNRQYYLDVANMFIFGFSKFATSFKGGEL